MTKPARAIADLERGAILATVDIAVHADRVFRALTTDELTQWWGQSDMYKTTKYTADLRVGGAWRSEGVGVDGKPFVVEGEFLEIEPPRKIVQTWRPSWDTGATTTITYLLEPIDRGTRVTVRHEGFGDRRDSCAGHSAGWERVLGWLTGHLDADRRGHFMIRLLPPRPTFMQDMTEDERAMMLEHVKYWTAKLQAGTAVLFGPVADPTGGWGLGVIRARDEAEVRAFEAEDPAVRSGRGLRYEVLPMLRAVYNR